MTNFCFLVCFFQRDIIIHVRPQKKKKKKKGDTTAVIELNAKVGPGQCGIS